MKKQCPLCNTQADEFYKEKQTYYKCPTCLARFVDEAQLPDAISEKARYELHDDNAQDLGYRKFVSPITKNILNDFTQEDLGLDFGAGTSAIISSVLKEDAYKIKNYDPYFHNYPELLEEKYDYISSCEVIEHFYTPYKEFKLLREMLQEGGKLYLMTDMYDENIDFASWYYKNDPTHVFLYTQETFEWIKKEFGFKSLVIEGRLVMLGL